MNIDISNTDVSKTIDLWKGFVRPNQLFLSILHSISRIFRYFKVFKQSHLVRDNKVWLYMITGISFPKKLREFLFLNHISKIFYKELHRLWYFYAYKIKQWKKSTQNLIINQILRITSSYSIFLISLFYKTNYLNIFFSIFFFIWHYQMCEMGKFYIPFKQFALKIIYGNKK